MSSSDVPQFRTRKLQTAPKRLSIASSRGPVLTVCDAHSAVLLPGCVAAVILNRESQLLVPPTCLRIRDFVRVPVLGALLSACLRQISVNTLCRLRIRINCCLLFHSGVHLECTS